MQGVFKPERLRMLNERHWQQVLRDGDGHNYKERVAYLRAHERKLSRSMRAELFVPNDITSGTHGWYAATVHAYCHALAVGGVNTGRFRVVYDVDTARPEVKGEMDIDTWEDLLLLARKLYIRAEHARDLEPLCFRPLYIAAGCGARFESDWPVDCWRVPAVQAIDRACREPCAASFLKPAQELFTELRQPKKLRIFHAQIGGAHPYPYPDRDPSPLPLPITPTHYPYPHPHPHPYPYPLPLPITPTPTPTPTPTH